jgi:hypothetical protein
MPQNCRRSKNFLSKLIKEFRHQLLMPYGRRMIFTCGMQLQTSLLLILWGTHSSPFIRASRTPTRQHHHLSFRHPPRDCSFNDQRYRCSYGGFNRPFNCAPALRRNFVQSCRGLSRGNLPCRRSKVSRCADNRMSLCRT